LFNNPRVLFPVLGLLCGAVLAAQTASQGVVAGTVFEAQTGRPLPNVKITIEGRAAAFVSDTAGKFQFALPPGTYKLKFELDNYAPSEVSDVSVVADEAVDASAVLSNKSIVTTVDVVEKITAAASSAEAALVERKLAAVVSDSISKEEISGGTASDAAGAVQKVTGVSIVDNGYVYVRGLGERYSSTMLNGAMIPTTEPEKRVVPLDLFPAQLIESVRILKTYTPDLPAEFSGGLVQMHTVEFPTRFTLRFATSVGGNTRTTGQRFLSYPGGGNDYFGFDDGTRQLPRVIPRNQRIFPGTFPAATVQDFGRAFANNWEPTVRAAMRPAISHSVVGGGTVGRFGIVGAVTFSNRPQFQSEVQRYIRQGAGQPIIFTNYEDFNVNNESARLGAVFNVAIRLTPLNKLVFRNTLTHDADKEARRFSGFDGGVDGIIATERVRFIERSLFSTSLEGEHSLPKFGTSIMRWQLTYSQSSRDEPDLREVVRNRLSDGRFIFAALGGSGFRFFNRLDDRILEPQGEFGVPFVRGSLSGMFKVGFRGSFREREFQARRFRYIPQQSQTLNLFAPSNQLFASENIRPNGFQLVEFTRASDRYDASMDIYGGYAMVDLAIGPKWRIVGGIRVEDANINVTSLDPLVPNAPPIIASLINRDPTPGVNVIYALTAKQNLRFGFSRTLSRPDFRELAPFDFNNVLGGFVAEGNPRLRRATIDNFDARWEWFFGGNQVLAASFFYKSFVDPIEVTIVPVTELRQTYINAAGARNYGFELEARKTLGFLRPWLRQFTLQGNFTFVDSNVRIRPEDRLVLTTQERPLLGQSRYIMNAIVDWARPAWRSNAKFSANSVSRRISDVGTFSVPDIYQERNTFLDFTYQFTFDEQGRYALRFNAENLLDNTYRWTQGPFLQRRFQVGRTFSVGFGYTIF
jgi:outer membrane receptor protein involved in Fe transport